MRLRRAPEPVPDAPTGRRLNHSSIAENGENHARPPLRFSPPPPRCPRSAPPSRAADWKAKYPELIFAVVPAENASGVADRYAPFVAYLSKELGMKVTLRIANDYAAVIEGQRAGNIHIGYYGPASFARALLTGVKTEAFAIDVNSDGTKGYYSVFYVKARSPYQDDRGSQGQEPRPGRSELDLRLQHAAVRARPEAASIRKPTSANRLHRQPRERRARAGPGHGRRRRQLVEQRQRFQPDAHAQQGHAEERRRFADEEGRLPHHPEVRPDHQLALRLSGRPAGTT